MTESLVTVDGHFLSARNPLATSEQRDLVARALTLLGHPQVQRASEQMAGRWRTVVGRDITAEAEARFGELVEEFTFKRSTR